MLLRSHVLSPPQSQITFTAFLPMVTIIFSLLEKAGSPTGFGEQLHTEVEVASLLLMGTVC